MGNDKTSQTIICKICGVKFEWSEGEQAFYKDRNLAPPKRCKDCRAKKKEVKE